MRYFVGIDLHSDSNYTGVIDKKDSRIFGKKLPNDLGAILKELKPFKKEIQGIVVESTYNWYWLVDGLQEAKYKVHLANPAEMQQYSGMKYTDDKWDSYWLAHMLAFRYITRGVYLSERNKADTGFIEKANDVGAAQTCPRGNGERRMY